MYICITESLCISMKGLKALYLETQISKFCIKTLL